VPKAIVIIFCSDANIYNNIVVVTSRIGKGIGTFPMRKIFSQYVSFYARWCNITGGTRYEAKDLYENCANVISELVTQK
jgi:hypothetical protein